DAGYSRYFSAQPVQDIACDCLRWRDSEPVVHANLCRCDRAADLHDTGYGSITAGFGGFGGGWHWNVSDIGGSIAEHGKNRREVRTGCRALPTIRVLFPEIPGNLPADEARFA